MMQGISGMKFPFCFNYQSVINKCFEIYDPFLMLAFQRKILYGLILHYIIMIVIANSLYYCVPGIIINISYALSHLLLPQLHEVNNIIFF